MDEAAGLGALSASSLLVGTLLVYLFKPSRRLVGGIMAFGAGALISSVSYELVLDLLRPEVGALLVGGLLTGATTFYVGDLLIDRMGGSDRKRSTGGQSSGSALAIFLGTVLDGIPESFILGSALATGGDVAAAFLAGVFLSNLPEAMAATYGLNDAGWSRARVIGLWVGVVLVSIVSAVAGYAVFHTGMSETTGSAVQAFAAGALLAMLADTMMPEAYEDAGKLVGLLTALGFSAAVLIQILER